MEHASTYILLFITLLQRCRADSSGTWYSANVINDGDFSPKPISEIFSTPPFSSTNPIVVLSQSTTPSAPISTSVTPGGSSYSTTVTPEFISTYSTNPSTLQTLTSYMPSSSWSQPFNPPENKPMFEPFPFPLRPETNNGNDLSNNLIYQQAQSLPPSAPQQTFPATSSFQPSSTPQPEWTPPQSTFPQSTFSTFAPDVTSRPTTLSTFQPEISSIPTTLSTFRPETTNTQTTLFFTPSSESTFPPRLPSSPQPTPSNPSPTPYNPSPTLSNPSPTPPPTPFDPPRSSTTATTAVTRTSRTIPPCNGTATPGTNLFARYPSLRIRMVAPSGSITNVNINPQTTTRRTTTTRRRTTTTRRPTTTRTRRTKRGRNTFNNCVNVCENRGRNPICAGPLAQIPVDTNRLKGFPSVCHMACHNSFKRDQYEMLAEGKCGRLRTRINTIDSNKLNRLELNKAQYTVVQGPETVLEFSALQR